MLFLYLLYLILRRDGYITQNRKNPPTYESMKTDLDCEYGIYSIFDDIIRECGIYSIFIGVTKNKILQEAIMNIQIFGTKKCSDTRKAERFFKERGIKFQFIDMKEKGMSKGEFNSVAQANGGVDSMINWEGKDKDTLALIKYISEDSRLEKILENPQVIKTPVVRNGKQSTLGYQPEVWKSWS